MPNKAHIALLIEGIQVGGVSFIPLLLPGSRVYKLGCCLDSTDEHFLLPANIFSNVCYWKSCTIKSVVKEGPCWIPGNWVGKTSCRTGFFEIGSQGYVCVSPEQWRIYRAAGLLPMTQCPLNIWRRVHWRLTQVWPHTLCELLGYILR